MKLLAPLIAVLLDFGPDLSKNELETILIATHAKQKLREPVQTDDLYWLAKQALSLIRMRQKCLFLKKYPERIAYRLKLQSSDDLECLAGLLAKMFWQPVLSTSSQLQALLQPFRHYATLNA